MDDQLDAREMETPHQSFQCGRGGADGVRRERDVAGAEAYGVQGESWNPESKTVKVVSKSDGRMPQSQGKQTFSILPFTLFNFN